jgi:predicted PurR-regulated permease PerM
VPRTRKHVPLADRIRSGGLISWALIGILLLLYVVFRFVLRPLAVVFPPLIIATVVAYVLNPLVGLLERRGMRRGLAVALVFITFLGIVSTLLSLLIPVVSAQLTSLLDQIPTYTQKVTTEFNEFATRRGLSLRLEAPDDLATLIKDNRSTILSFLGGVRSFAGQVLHIFITVVIGVVLSVYLLIDLPRMRRALVKAIPPDYREETVEIAQKVGTALGGFFRGQLLVALFVGVASALVLTYPVRLPFAVVIGLVAGVFNLIPLIGPFLAAVPAIIVGVFSDDPIKALWASVALLVVQQIDNHIISPNVMGRTVQLHPITVMLALLAGGTIAGIPGMLIVIPAVASVKIVSGHLWSKRRELGVPENIAEAGS